MDHLWIPEIPILEKVLRSAAVYFFILVALRFTGKRQVGQLTPFDLVVLLLLSNVVQNAVTGPDNSLAGGLIGAATILGLNYVVAEISYRFKPARHLLEGDPTILVHNGKVLKHNLQRERINMNDLSAALRKNGVSDVSSVRFAVLEENGQISVVPKAKGRRS